MADRPPASSQQPTITIIHPNKPEVRVIAGKTSRADSLDLIRELRHSSQPAIDEAGKFWRGEDGGILWKPTTPLDYAVLGLVRIIKGWEGINDEKGQPIPCERKNLGVLTEDWLDVTEDGKPPEAFSRYISERVADPAAWDTDPKTKG